MNGAGRKELIAYWPMDEGKGRTVREAVTGQEDAVHYVFNEASYTVSRDPQWRPGVHGGSLSFDGYSTYVRHENGKRLSCASFSIEAWVAPRSYEWGDEGKLSAIVNQHDRELCHGYILGMFRHGSWSFQFGLDGGWTEVWADDAYPLRKNQWSHIAAVFNGSEGTVKLYLNGREAGSKDISPGSRLEAGPGDLLIGRNNCPAKLAEIFTLSMFSGLIDEVKLYGDALSAEEIAASFAQTLSVHGGDLPPIRKEDIALDRSPLLQDKHRPKFHISPPAHWMNEPHAPVYFNGQYHLFYQHNPQGPYFHGIHWGHWVSDDLVHWRDLPVALAPERDELAPDGIWSGSASYDESGLPVLFFTAGHDGASPNQRIALARSTFEEDGDNDLVRWIKHPDPLIIQKQGMGLFGDFRDPFVWRDGTKWYMLVCSGTDGQGGTALAFVSDNMLDWTYKGPFYIGNDEKYPYLGPVWELPVLLPLGEDAEGRTKHLFLISPVGSGADVEVFYWIGELDKENVKFHPDQEEPQLVDVGDFHFTGPSGMVDPRTGRNIVFTIAQGERTSKAEYEAGWAHNAGLPVHLFLRQDGRIGVEPIEELQSLRGEKLADIHDVPVEQINRLISGIQGDMLEIRIRLKAGTATQMGIKVRRSPGGEEETLLYYDAGEQMLKADRSKTSRSPEERCGGIQGGHLELKGEDPDLHIYVDHSMIEMYANGLKSLTTRAYPSRPDALGLQVWADGTLQVKSLEIWAMKSIFK